jgi:hypothetical protein
MLAIAQVNISLAAVYESQNEEYAEELFWAIYAEHGLTPFALTHIEVTNLDVEPAGAPNGIPISSVYDLHEQYIPAKES